MSSASSISKTWLVNSWYVACTPDEIVSVPLSRQICGIQLVIFRNEDGKVAALEDFCPHRGAPLSLGFVRGNSIVCGYHGLAVDCSGRAESMPGQRVKNFPPIRRIPAIEYKGFIWVWPGDDAVADPSLLPPLEWAENPNWAYGGGLYHIKCDYRLMIDNLMDLTHETYVHSTSIGQKEIDEAPVKTRAEGEQVITSREMEGVIAPPFWAMAMRAAGHPDPVPVDRWQVCRFNLPSNVMIDVGVAVAGTGGYHAPLSKKASSTVVDFITPETEASHWYFWGMARQFAIDDTAMTDAVRDGQGRIFGEDLEMLERQQQNLLNYPERKLLRLNIDAGGARSRLMIDRAIAVEASASPLATALLPAE